LLVRLTCGWKVNITLGLQETGLDGMDWIHPTQVREQWGALVTKVINLQFRKFRKYHKELRTF
jgi:hypothetical protein